MKKRALFNSIIALILCVAMLAGSTFAWFTDSSVSTGNIIQSGTLDVELEYWDGSDWKTVQGATQLFGEDLWEPGYTEVLYLKVSNKGNLALKWQLAINIESEDPGTNKAGDSFKLSDHIYMGVVEGKQPEYDSREAAVAAVEGSSGIIGKGYSKFGEMDAGAAEQYLAVVVYMPTSVDNVANHNGVDDATIDMGIALLATQKSAESDSFGSDYDAAAKHPLGDINYTAAQSVKEKADDQGNLAETVTVGNEGDEIYAEVPAGVKLADGAEELELTVQAMNESKANVTLENGEVAASLDVHMEGVAEDNTVPMLITLQGLFKTGLNSTSVAMYHVENGVTVPMTLVTNPTSHNEFSYDPATGDVVMCVATFSEYVAVTDNRNLWEGVIDTSWYNTTAAEFTLNTADQLAGFGAIVDGTAEGIAADTFKGKTVKLGADIDLSGGYSLNPIGCGYVNGTANSNGVEGRAFMGTFDGQGHTIFGLYQNGWELGLSYCTLGGGLFASVANGVIKNLTIDGANIVMECVDMGILVGYSQGECTYENISIYHSAIANYQRYTGGVVGEVSPMDGKSTHTFTNIHVGPTTVVGSLWGDFDASCGGIIGGKWDSTGVTKVNMTNCKVACRMDVYNDVTSAYQWYAYRRAGMLIGNTEETATGEDGVTVAAASYLYCTDVWVYYDTWADYTYCQFTNENNPGKDYPWVRVELGENNSAYSNPRYGHPVDVDGNEVKTDIHFHQTGDQCHEKLPFNQLYGGGQGVYGAASHDGVTTGMLAYDVVYMDSTRIVEVEYITDNSMSHSVKTAGTGYQWLDAEGKEVTSIPAGNTKDVVLQRDEIDVYVAYFVDRDGITIYEETFTEKDRVLKNAPAEPPYIDGYIGQWEPYDNALKSATGSIVIKPLYTLADTEILTNVNAVFDALAAGRDIVMSQEMTGSQANASKEYCCTITEGTTDTEARLNLNSYVLNYTFNSNANKNWHVFNITAGSTFIISGGVNNDGVLKMTLDALNNNAYSNVFTLRGGGTLVLEKGVTVEFHYPAAAAARVQAIELPNNVQFDPADYPGLEYSNENGIIRMYAKETTIIRAPAT